MALADQPANDGNSAQGAANGDQQSGNPKGAVALPVKQPTGKPETAVANEQPQTEQPSPYGLRDLKAQEDMAFWAMLMFLAAVATFIVTSIGTVLIWRQVKLTRQAVEDTGEATEAMREANEIARDSARRQLRAYVGVRRPEVQNFVVGGTPSIGFIIANSGQTPAYDVVCYAEGIFTEDDPHEVSARFKNIKKSKRSRATLLPNSHGPGGGPISSEMFTEEHLDNIRKGLVNFVYFGVFSYTDAFAKRHRGTFKHFLDAKLLNQKGAARLRVCSKGNKSN